MNTFDEVKLSKYLEKFDENHLENVNILINF